MLSLRVLGLSTVWRSTAFSWVKIYTLMLNQVYIWIYIYIYNVKFALEQTTKAQRGSRGIALLFLDLCAIWGWVVSATPRPLYSRERPDTHCIWGWVGPRAGLNGCGKFRPPPPPPGIRFPDRPTRSESLYRVRYIYIKWQIRLVPPPVNGRRVLIINSLDLLFFSPVNSQYVCFGLPCSENRCSDLDHWIHQLGWTREL